MGKGAQLYAPPSFGVAMQVHFILNRVSPCNRPPKPKTCNIWTKTMPRKGKRSSEALRLSKTSRQQLLGPRNWPEDHHIVHPLHIAITIDSLRLIATLASWNSWDNTASNVARSIVPGHHFAPDRQWLDFNLYQGFKITKLRGLVSGNGREGGRRDQMTS